MPQLAPLSWALAPLLFWFILMLLTSSMWWASQTNFPSSQQISISPFSNWNWK